MNYGLTDAQIAALAYRIAGMLRAGAQAIPEVPLVDTLNGITSFPAVQTTDGVPKYVRAPISLLGQPAWDAVAGYIQQLEEAIDSIDDTVAAVVGASDEVAQLKAAIAAAKLAASNATSSSAAATAAARVAGAAASETDGVRLQALAVIEIVREMLAEGRSEIEAMQAIRELIIADATLAPTRMEVAAPKVLTLTNRTPQRITARVFPAYLVQNILYQQPVNGGASVAVAPDGSFEILGIGVSRVHVVPANNTALWQTVEINVRPPVVRLTSDGKVRLAFDGTARMV